MIGRQVKIAKKAKTFNVCLTIYEVAFRGLFVIFDVDYSFINLFNACVLRV